MKTDNLLALHAHPLIALAAISVMVLCVLGVAALTGVLPTKAGPNPEGVAPAGSAGSGVSSQPLACALCGTIEWIRIVEIREDAGVESGNEGAITILGTGGRAASGDEGAKSARKRHAYRVIVRMDDGSYRTVSFSEPPSLAVGDKVRVIEGKLVRA